MIIVEAIDGREHGAGLVRKLKRGIDAKAGAAWRRVMKQDRSTRVPSRWRHRAARAAMCMAALAGAGCASYGPSGLAPGASVADIIARMGQPTGEYRNPDGTRRLEYARGPAGRHTYMLDLDADGRLRTATQVLDDAHFARIVPGMPREELLREIGRPAEIMPIAWQHVQLYNYRYENPFCLFFQVDVDAAGKVRDAGNGPDPTCTPRRE
jgi:hypothetical protein